MDVVDTDVEVAVLNLNLETPIWIVNLDEVTQVSWLAVSQLHTPVDVQFLFAGKLIASCSTFLAEVL